MRLVDSHAHLDFADYAGGELEAVLTRARAAGLVHVVCVGQFRDPGELGPGRRGGMDGALDAIELARRDRAFFSATSGIHPHDAAKAGAADFARLEEQCADPAVVAVGECGLDFHYDRSPREVQREVFVRQLELARREKKPVVVHTREADVETAELLQRHLGPEGGVIHCFTSDWTAAQRYLSLGLYLSFSGVLTFRTAEATRDAAARAPLERLLVETDCPFLAPIPHRGKRNEPAWVLATAERLAALRGLPVEELAEATTANAARALRLPVRSV